MWSEYVSLHLLPRVHGFEFLMAAYTIAHLKLGLQLKDYGYDFKSTERLNIFLTNTLDEAHNNQTTLLSEWLSNEANLANAVKRDKPVMVILGNPPYSGHSANSGQWIKELVHDYKKDFPELLKPAQSKWLQDDYVKFIRFAHWRIMQTGYGILAFVTNHSYLDNPTFRGMRYALLKDFDEIYILDMHGNTKKKETALDGSIDKNIFDIQQGVAIGIFIKYQRKDLSGFKNLTGLVHHAHLFGERKTKYTWLAENDIETTQWTELKPQAPSYFFIPQNINKLKEYQGYYSIVDMMNKNGDPAPGIITTHDEFAISWTKQQAKEKVFTFLKTETEIEARQLFHLCSQKQWNYNKAKKALRIEDWQNEIIPILYRPFDKRWIIYNAHVAVHRRERVMQHIITGDNLGLITIRRSRSSTNWRQIFVSNSVIAGATSISSLDINYLFPLYIYPTEKTKLFNLENETRQPNFSSAFITDLETKLNLSFIAEGNGDFKTTISALNVFYYMYAVFYSPSYRTRYSEFLKMDFPRLPLTSNKNLFQHLAVLGEQLVNLHLMQANTKSECHYPIDGDNFVDKIEYKDNKVYINKTQYFDKVELSVWEFYIGGYQVCSKWLKDRKAKILSYDDLTHYLNILAIIKETQLIMSNIDLTIGEFPIS